MEFLTHYYNRDGAPFRSLSYLDEEAALEIIRDFDCQAGVVYKRVKKPRKYLEKR